MTKLLILSGILLGSLQAKAGLLVFESCGYTNSKAFGIARYEGYQEDPSELYLQVKSLDSPEDSSWSSYLLYLKPSANQPGVYKAKDRSVGIKYIVNFNEERTKIYNEAGELLSECWGIGGGGDSSGGPYYE